MELVCEKYKEKMARDGAVCRHPGEYCKFRSSCIIHFLSKEAAVKRDHPLDPEREAGEDSGPDLPGR